jgi:hypothetical protein
MQFNVPASRPGGLTDRVPLPERDSVCHSENRHLSQL